MALRELIGTLKYDILKYGPAAAAKRLSRAILRKMTSPEVARLVSQIQASPAAIAHQKAIGISDAYFPVASRHYLCQSLTTEERVNAAWSHYSFVDTKLTEQARDALAGKGLPLWSVADLGQDFEIRLMAGNHNMYEGGFSTAFFVNNRHVGVISFSIIEGGMLGMERGETLLICRNQTTSDRWYQKPLQQRFKHIALPYLMLAAVSGVARALNANSIAAILEAAHPGQRGNLEETDQMKGSYSEFWGKYGAKPLRNGVVRIALPLETTPLDQVSSNHRRRAKARRELMDEVAESACRVFLSAIVPGNAACRTISESGCYAGPMVLHREPDEKRQGPLSQTEHRTV